MAEHVLTVLRAKREQIAGQVHDTEAKLAKLRAALANLDAAMNILTPDHPDFIPARKRQSGYFKRSELPRIVRAAFRDAGKPLSTAEIAAYAISDRGLPASALQTVIGSVAAMLNAGARRGEFERIGKTRGAKWSLPG